MLTDALGGDIPDDFYRIDRMTMRVVKSNGCAFLGSEEDENNIEKEQSLSDYRVDGTENTRGACHRSVFFQEEDEEHMYLLDENDPDISKGREKFLHALDWYKKKIQQKSVGDGMNATVDTHLCEEICIYLMQDMHGGGLNGFRNGP